MPRPATEPPSPRRRLPRPGRPGLRSGVVVVSGAVVLVMAILVANTVADHVTRTAVDEAVSAAATMVRGDVDELLTAKTIETPTAAQANQINERLVRLVGVGHLLRIKVWAPDGTVAFSDAAGLRGKNFGVASDLREALDGQASTEIAAPDAAENVLEEGLAARVLQIYMPIRDPGTGEVIGSYEVYQDAAPIEAHVEQTRGDVLMIVGGASAALLLVLYLAFSATSRRLGRQNRLLMEQAQAQEVLATDLRRSEERFRSLVQNSADIIVVTTPDGTIRYESPAVERVLGHTVGERVGQSVDDLIHPEDLETSEQLRTAVRGTGGQARAELRIRHTDGDWRILEVVAADYTQDPAVRGIVLNYHDVTDRVRLEQQLTHQAFHDALTGLANRALFRDRVTHALSRHRRRRPLAVLFLDLDDFKSVNDIRGHSRGDELLAAVARRVEGALRSGDTAARLGGDEFAILVEEATDALGPIRVADRILASLREPIELAGEPIVVRASIGIALSEPGQTTDELLANADLAMYLAKGAGGHRYALYDASMHLQAAERLSLKTDLERVLQNDELFLTYQPIVDLATNAVTGVEALVRWRHPLRGVISPGAFIPIAEESNLIIEIGEWVMRRACEQVIAFDRPGRRLSVAVNVSARQLQDEGFVESVGAILTATGIRPDRLILEMTETVLIQDIETAIGTLHRLRSLGVRLAIDDFGTGYSSLTYLHRFPVDILKIDRSFVGSVTSGPSESSLVSSIVKMARTLGLRTIAEGIEQQDQLQELRRVGADEGQGYLLGYPVDLEGLAIDLAARPAGTLDRPGLTEHGRLAEALPS